MTVSDRSPIRRPRSLHGAFAVAALALAALALGAVGGCSPGPDDCLELLPLRFRELAVPFDGETSGVCSLHIANARVDVQALRGVARWRPGRVWIEGREVGWPVFERELLASVRPDRDTCAAFMPGPAIGVEVVRIPSGGYGCRGLVDGVQVEVETVLAPGGWERGRFWLAGYEVTEPELRRELRRASTIESGRRTAATVQGFLQGVVERLRGN